MYTTTNTVYTTTSWALPKTFYTITFPLGTSLFAYPNTYEVVAIINITTIEPNSFTMIPTPFWPLNNLRWFIFTSHNQDVEH